MSYGQSQIIALCFSMDINALRAKSKTNITSKVKRIARRASMSIEIMNTKTITLPVGH